MNERAANDPIRNERSEDTMVPPCGVCGMPAEWMATVPMCGERPRYPICSDCLDPIAECGYAEDVELLDA